MRILCNRNVIKAPLMLFTGSVGTRFLFRSLDWILVISFVYFLILTLTCAWDISIHSGLPVVVELFNNTCAAVKFQVLKTFLSSGQIKVSDAATWTSPSSLLTLEAMLYCSRISFHSLHFSGTLESFTRWSVRRRKRVKKLLPMEGLCRSVKALVCRLLTPCNDE